MGKSFSLKDFAMPVPESGTEGREQIQYIPLANLIEDEANFYSIEGVEELARNISTVGLQQPLRVRRGEGDDYIIVSGHRRFAALSLLVEEDAERWDEVACIVEAEGESPKLTELRLIFANMDTRKMSSADVARQAERVQELLYELKEEGYEFPGRMRDWVAEAVGVSKSKLSRLDAIRKNLIVNGLCEAWKSNLLNESVAYELSQLPPTLQFRALDLIIDSGKSYDTLTAADVREIKATVNRGYSSKSEILAWCDKENVPACDSDLSPAMAELMARTCLVEATRRLKMRTPSKAALIDFWKAEYGSHYSGSAKTGLWYDFSPKGVEFREPLKLALSWNQIYDAVAASAIVERPVNAFSAVPAWHSCQDDPPEELAWVFVVEDHEEFTISRGIARYRHGRYYLDGDEDFDVTLRPEHVWFPCVPTKNMEQWLGEEATDEN